MLQRSSIVSPEEELQEYYARLRTQHIAPAWLSEAVSVRPETKAVPYVWHWRDLRPQVMRAAQLVGTAQAERRVLRLHNPGLPGASASTTLAANIQIVMPGEIARAHRHSASALRFIIEGEGGYTVVNGARIPMAPGDLVLTPNWTWHDHANDTDAPMIWLDGLDTPLVRMLEAGFYEPYGEEAQPIGEGADPSLAKYGAGGLRPAWEPAPAARYSPLWHYPLSQARAALERLAAEGAGSPFDGVILEYINPATGGPVMPTIACYIQLLQPGEHTQAHRQVCCTNYHVIEGSGYSLVGDRQLDWEDKDVFTVPTWTFHEHVNTGERPALLFSFSDAPVMKALDLYREEPRRE
ncbi:MAG TPA: cupin domain-containing protein [Alphaproteobacteria bacterium]|nr:cupin domain-containing protein [Alphaproteobacteria bacterium]